MSKIAILGTGSWSSALAQVLCDNGHEVLMYGIDQQEMDDINFNHRNDKYFDVDLSPKIKATASLEECLKGASYLLITIPTAFVRDVLNEVKKVLDHKITIINAAKGFDNQFNLPMSATIRSVLDESMRDEVVSIIGPSHAEEVICRMLTCVCSVSLDLEKAKEVQHLFSNAYFRVYRHDDEIGAEYAVALKNVIAVASGCAAGLGYGDNTRAALITRGLAEVVRYGIKKGGRFETFLGLTGIGDLVVTCSSEHSRNFQAGYQIGLTGDAKTFIKENKKTVEGIRTCKVVFDDLKNYDDLQMPIVEATYQVLYENKDPKDVIRNLMLRDLKQEQ